jgi:hypothetical protein
MGEKSNKGRLRMNAGDTIYYFKIIVDFLKNEARTEIEEYKILGINDKHLVLDDYSFTCLDLKKESCNIHAVLNTPSSYHFKLLEYHDEIQTSLYTLGKNRKRAFSKIKKATEKYIYEKFGRYCNGIEILNDLEVEE